MKKELFAWVLIGGLAVSVPASAQNQGKQRRDPSPEKVIAMFDTNKDGSISIEEARVAEKAGMYRKFGRIDVDRDGKVTIEELRAHAEARKSRQENVKE